MRNILTKVKNFFCCKKEKFSSFIDKKLEKIKNITKPKLDIIKHFFTKVANKLHLPQIVKFTKLDKLYSFLKRIRFLRRIFLILFIPLLIYLYSQFFCNGKLIFELPRMQLNFLLIYMIICFFYCLFGRLKLSLYLTLFLTFIIGLINHFITAFRGTPLVPWDIFSLNVALTVLPTFKFNVTKKMIFGIALFLIGLLTVKKVKIRSFRNVKSKILFRIITLGIILIFFFNFYTTNLISNFNLDENWDPKEEYHNNGLIASLFKQSRNLIISQPEGYDINSITELANSIEVSKVHHEENYEYPNIIAIMNESFSDLSVVGDFSTNTEYLPFFKSLNKNTIKGNLHVSIFGATTPNSEWEFLTSNSMAFVPKRTVPYQQYVLRNSYSLATILKSQGYSTHAIHCYYPQGYNRNLAYPRLGFNSFYHIYTMHDLEYIREYPSDLSTYKNIIKIFENKSRNEKIFNFTLTMQNHGSYTDENFTNTVIAENNQYPKLNQYLSLIKIADNSLEYLIDYFSKIDEPTIIVLFGDHQTYV